MFIGLFPSFLSLYNLVFLWNGFIWFISLLYSVVFLSPRTITRGFGSGGGLVCTIEDWVRVPALIIERWVIYVEPTSPCFHPWVDDFCITESWFDVSCWLLVSWPGLRDPIFRLQILSETTAVRGLPFGQLLGDSSKWFIFRIYAKRPSVYYPQSHISSSYILSHNYNFH